MKRLRRESDKGKNRRRKLEKFLYQSWEGKKNEFRKMLLF
jgi:hypothetical protein